MIKVLYFAWVRERIGVSYEMVETESETIIGLVDELRESCLLYTSPSPRDS